MTDQWLSRWHATWVARVAGHLAPLFTTIYYPPAAVADTMANIPNNQDLEMHADLGASTQELEIMAHPNNMGLAQNPIHVPSVSPTPSVKLIANPHFHEPIPPPAYEASPHSGVDLIAHHLPNYLAYPPEFPSSNPLCAVAAVMAYDLFDTSKLNPDLPKVVTAHALQWCMGGHVRMKWNHPGGLPRCPGAV
ncbi:hypothetical protein B0F90DRAFT_1667825 [Multifurca ochricompacta]|uniref:Uncharacterized protein n=1 Tax=Multifurca ochricompacta TaxID=376703 RepID=A0AAD4M4P6_9AGAM|nr:hypothetical protein B0F90DRAFT_1667825 [Multifurca ochricompacta]